MHSLSIIVLVLVGLSIIYGIRVVVRRNRWKLPTKPFPTAWRKILFEKVGFYRSLDADAKKHFEYELQEFLLNVNITGIRCTVDDTDKILIAASAVIPIFAYPDWKYFNLDEVLLYPDRFSDDFEVEGNDRTILGMVGSGYMEGKMILSKPAIHHGFSNESDKRNTAVHEFVHLIDKADGNVDGIPAVLLNEPNAIPWLSMIDQEIVAIIHGDSSIDPYASYSREEFFAVVSEYFFERPKLLQREHAELYKALQKIFSQNPALRPRSRNKKVGRNDPCVCGSGKKFKHCCGNQGLNP